MIAENLKTYLWALLLLSQPFEGISREMPDSLEAEMSINI